MVNSSGNQGAVATTEPAPLHELMSRILLVQPPEPQGLKRFLPTVGTWQSLNQQLANQPLLDFINGTLRGVGQVIFVNNPFSGLLILLALFIQSSWVGALALVGVLAATLTAIGLQLDRETTRNGIFGYNGLLVGAALATFSDPGVGAGYGGWVLLTIIFASLTTVMMKTLGVWWAKTVNTPPLTLPFCILTLVCLALVNWLPQPWFQLATAGGAAPETTLTGARLAAALPIGVGQVFLAGKLISGLLILLAVALCTPLGALVGIIGGGLGLLAGLLLGIAPNTIYAGLWGYNAVLCAMAIGGIFYAPNLKSIVIGGVTAFLSAMLGGGLGLLFGTLGLPALTVSFCLATIGCFVLLQRSLPSLVPVALHAITSPEEHRYRYQAARKIITNFRTQLTGALAKERRFYLFEQASTALKGELRYLFNLIDTDQSETLSTQELSEHLQQLSNGKGKKGTSDGDLTYLFSCMDVDGNGTVDFKEFCELMLRHRQLMANYNAFVTYFLPIDANDDDAIGLDEMNVAMASVGTQPLSEQEAAYLTQQVGDRPLTWNRFIEMLLVT
ncbi:MAG: urea transporter [Cyanobacteria bacterium P01_F01_bin.53]